MASLVDVRICGAVNKRQRLCVPQSMQVIGVPDAEWGEAVAAFVVCRSGSDVTPDAMRAYCRERLAGYKIPKTIQLVDEIERNGLGKVTPGFRNKARAQLNGDQGGAYV